MALKQQQYISSVTFNCVYLTSPPAHKSLFSGGHLDCSKPCKKTNKKQPLNPGSAVIFCIWLTIAINSLCENLRDKCHIEIPNKRFTIKKSLRLVMHLNKGTEYRASSYCHHPNPPPISKRKGWRWWWCCNKGPHSCLSSPRVWCRGLLNVPCRIDPYDP